MQQNTGNFLCKLIARKIHHFFFSFTLVLLLGIAPAWSAGYSCPTYKKYTSCNAGYYMTNSSGTYNGTPAVGNSCTICPAGRYGSTTGLKTSTCTGVISAGRYGAAGATSASGSGAVSAGYYSTGGGTSATPTAAGNGCLSGYSCGKVSQGCYTSGTGSTNACPNSCVANATTSSTGATSVSSCICKAGYSGNASTTSGTCTACSAGYYKSSAGNTSCSAAGTGYYVSTTASTTRSACTSWRANTSTTGTTSTSTSQCLCKAGYYLNSSNVCTACSTGTYKSAISNASSCTTAGSGYYVSTTGATAQSACTSWRANTNTNGATGSTSTSACVCKAGYYLNSSNVCTACSTGAYKSANSNASSCTTAGSGYYVSTTGATAQSACTSWRANTNTNGATGSTSTSACVCKAGYYLNGSTCTACSTGTYKSANSNASSCTTAGSGYYVSTTGATAQSACTSWRANTNTNGATGSTSTDACVCKAGTYLSGSTCTSCGAGTYKSANSNATSCTSCTTTSGWTTTTSGTGSTAYTACYQTQTPANCASGTIKRTASSISGTTITYGTASITSALSSSPGAYVNGTSCTLCPNGKFYGGGTATSCTSCPTLDSGYSYVSGTGWSSYSSCKEQMRPTNCYSGYLTKTATSATAWGTATNNITAKGGYKVSGSGNSATCSACGYGSYSANGATSCTTCPTADSGWTVYSTSNVSTSYSACYEYKSGTNISSYCSAGELRRAASSASAYSATVTISTALQAKAGSIVSGQTCTQCSGGKYSAGGTATSCGTIKANCYGGAGSSTECPNSCTANSTSAAGSDAISDCSCNAGYSGNAATSGGTCTACAKGTYKSSGGNTTCTSAGSGYYVDTTGATSRKACSALDSSKTDGTYSSVSPYDANTTCRFTQNAQTVPTYCATKTSNTMSYSGTAWPANTYAVTAKAGSIISGNNTASATCSQCGAGKYSAGGTATSCGTCANWTYSSAGAASCTACLDVESGWTKASGTGWTSYSSCKETKTSTAISSYCTAGVLTKAQSSATAWDSASITTALKAAAGAYVNGQTCSQCSAGTYQATSGSTATSCSTITSGCYGGAGATSACPYNCNALTAPAVTGGTFSSVTPRSANTACRYVAPTKTDTECTSITANTVSYSGSAWGTNFYTAKANKGAYVSATGNTSAPACTLCACGSYQGSDSSTATKCTTTTAGYYAPAGAATQTKADAGYYAAAGACEQTKIQAGCFGGEGSSVACPNSCPAAETGWTLTSTTGLTVVTDCTETTTPSTSGSPIASICTAGTLTKKATSATAWGTATASGLTAKAGRYVNGTTCSACAAGTYTSAATTATSCTPASAGNYVSTTEATGQTKCPAGTYGSTTGLKTSACSGTCTEGYYCPAGSTSATQNACTAGNYCPAGAGAQTSCATVGGKLYINSADKSDAATDCYISLASKVYLASATSTSTTTCTAGYYCPGGDFYYSSSATNQGRSSCTGTTYSGSGAASCSNCPTGYTANTSNNKTAATSCQIACSAGTRVAEKNAQCTSPAGAWYSVATTTNYGQVSLVNYCMAGYASSSTAASGHDAKADCTQTIAGGKYVGSTKISARYIKVTTAGSTANTGSHVVEIQAFASNDGTGTNLLSGKGGVSGSNMTAATDGSWARTNYASGTMVWDMGSAQSIGSIKFALYTDGRVYSDVTISVSTDNATWTTVLGPVDIATQSVSTATGELIVLSAAPANCAAGTARASGSLALGNTNSCAVCGTSTYSDAGAASCTACATAKGYTNSGTTAASHAGTASCKATCIAGQYVATAGAGCVNVGAGYWGAGGTVGQNTTLGRTQCASGLTTIGYGTGANEAGDCGRKFHAGDNVIYLRSEKRGDTALNVKIGNQTFFGALSTTYASPIKVKKGTTTYSVVNDWQ